MSHATVTNCVFRVPDVAGVKQKMLNWAKQFSIFCFIDNNDYKIQPHTVECLLAAGAARFFEGRCGNALKGLGRFLESGPGWYFGHASYDLKNEIGPFTSSHPDQIGFPDVFFFEPLVLVRLEGGELTIEADDAEKIFEEIMSTELTHGNLQVNDFRIKHRVSKEEYIATVNKLRDHILRGDCYEINYCIEFFAECAVIDPFDVYEKLTSFSPNPFSTLYRLNDKYLVCASPERFIKKEGMKIISQPIKGTAKREPADKALDEANREALWNSAKDRSENVMVVDLVRNDLSKVCEEGTVGVEELFGIYSFPQVYQMISTVSGRLKKDVGFPEILEATFPMGSMTGAPKKRVLQLIEQYEKTKRGIFSGTVGYFDPEGGFDFNVVIRSLMYNAQLQFLSFLAGSAITYYSDAEAEWNECILKAQAIKKVLGN